MTNEIFEAWEIAEKASEDLAPWRELSDAIDETLTAADDFANGREAESIAVAYRGICRVRDAAAVAGEATILALLDDTLNPHTPIPNWPAALRVINADLCELGKAYAVVLCQGDHREARRLADNARIHGAISAITRAHVQEICKVLQKVDNATH